jgi:hypothetical protein
MKHWGMTMATITVTSALDDNGAGITLREAIAMAEANGTGADTIVFAASLAGQTIRLTQGTLEITQGTVTINGDSTGDGDFDVTISGDLTGDGNSADDLGTLLEISAGATATMKSMAFVDGYDVGTNANIEAVAGIENFGTLTVEDSVIAGMVASGFNAPIFMGLYHGGSAFAGVVNSGTLNVTDTIFESNVAIGGDGADGALFGPPYLGIAGTDGGSAVAGICNTSGSSLNIVNSGFVGNTADQGSGGNGSDGIDFGGHGGDSGSATTGILNFGTLTGTAGAASYTIIGGFGGGGGISIAGVENGPLGQRGAKSPLLSAHRRQPDRLVLRPYNIRR